MRPLIQLPALVFLGAIALAVWVAFREVPLERLEAAPRLGPSLAKLPPPGPKGTLEGILVDETGNPLADADLSTQQDGRFLWTNTNADGSFVLEGLQSGPLQVAVLARNRMPEVLSLVGPGKQVRLALQRSPEPVPTLPGITDSDWWGRIRNPTNRKKLSGFQVWLVPEGPADRLTSGIPRRVETDADGDFLVPGLIHAVYRMHVLPPGNQGALEPNLLVPLGAPAPLLDHGSGATPAEWVLQSGELFGRIEAEGKPVRSAMVMLEALADTNAETGQARVLPAIQTDTAGLWSAPNLPPARYRVRIRGGGLALEREIELRENQRVRVEF